MPHLVEQLGTSEDLAGGSGQEGEKVELPGRQIHGALGHRHGAGTGIDPPIAVVKNVYRPVGDHPTQDRFDPGYEFPGRERFDDVVVRSEFKTHYPVGLFGPSSQQDDGRRGVLISDLGEELQPGDPWQHDVEDDDIWMKLGHGTTGALSVRSRGNLVPLPAEVSEHHFANAGFVVHHQYPSHHGSTVNPRALVVNSRQSRSTCQWAAGAGHFITMPIAELTSVSYAVAGTPILTDINVVIEPGERIGVAGPNGAGKSTLLSILATLRSPTGGTGSVLGAHLGTDEVVGVRPRIGWSGHEPALYPELSLAENLHHIARLAAISTTRADELLDQVGLAGARDRRVAVCSNGMRRRADLARLLMTTPDLVLLDEAEAGLDEAASAIVAEIGRRTVARGGAVVTVSHDAAALKGRSDRVLSLSAGSLTQ